MEGLAVGATANGLPFTKTIALSFAEQFASSVTVKVKVLVIFRFIV